MKLTKSILPTVTVPTPKEACSMLRLAASFAIITSLRGIGYLSGRLIWAGNGGRLGRGCCGVCEREKFWQFLWESSGKWIYQVALFLLANSKYFPIRKVNFLYYF